MKMLGITTAARIPDHNNIPTIAEVLPGFSVGGWVAVLAPRGTPAAIVSKINTDLKAILEMPEVNKRLQSLGVYTDVANMSSPQALAQFIRQNSDSWKA